MERLIKELRETAHRVQDIDVLLHRAADVLSNQNSNILALQKRLEMARGERDIVTERMIQLEQENAQLIADVKKMLDCCDICIHQNDMPSCNGECVECADANSSCVCHDCRDSDKFQYRGLEEG